MKATIPNWKTRMPSRDGLCYYEIIADALAHSAVVFGIEPDERFVERVAVLAFTNGTYLAAHDPDRAAAAAAAFMESLEFGRSVAVQHCLVVCDKAMDGDVPFAGLHRYFRKTHPAWLYAAGSAGRTGWLRTTIGEAAVAGLLSRGACPAAHELVLRQVRLLGPEHRFLLRRLQHWAATDGLPQLHPFLELCVDCYPCRTEAELLCSSIARILPQALDSESPWDVAWWLKQGWKDGMVTAEFTPERMKPVIDQMGNDARQLQLCIFRECVTPAVTHGKVDQLAAFNRYLAYSPPFGDSDETVYQTSPRLCAWSAYDFAFWMGFIAGRMIQVGRHGDVWEADRS